jgi:hypothetical protein
MRATVGSDAPAPASGPPSANVVLRRPRIPRRTWGILGIIGVLIAVALVLSAVILVPRPSYAQPPVQVKNHSLVENVTWNETNDVPLSWGPYSATSTITENRTNNISDLTLRVWLGPQQTPAGIQYVVYSIILGNVSSHLRPSSLTTVASDYPGSYTDPLLHATFVGSAGNPSTNISYPQPLGYTGNSGFTGIGAIVDTVGLSGVNGQSRFFFMYPAEDFFTLAYPTNDTTVYNTFHISVALNGITPIVVCSVAVNITDHYSSSQWG